MLGENISNTYICHYVSEVNHATPMLFGPTVNQLLTESDCTPESPIWNKE